MRMHAYAAVRDGSTVQLLSSRSPLCKHVTTTISPDLATSTASKPYWSVIFSLAPSAIEEANAAVISVCEEAAAKNCGHYHHFSMSVCASMGVFKIIIGENLCPYKNSGLIEHFIPRKSLAIQYVY